MTRIRTWLQGKKTYICAAVLAGIGGAGYFSGAIPGTTASAVLCAAGGLAGLGAKSQRTADAILAALSNVRDAQARAASQQKSLDARQLVLQVVRELGPTLAANLIDGLGVPDARPSQEATEAQR